MRTRKIAASAASMALAMTGLVGVSSATAADSSATALKCSNRQYFTGSGGHAGASLTCTGGAFTAKATCIKAGEPNYVHFGNRTTSGGTSTVWCDVGSAVKEPLGYVSS
ncbi:hypothetical protein [Streptomyces sp. NPDC058622]|uniref:hypothetical protein n=1 Tax=Streptomyces sp. NPDC058622 TaxID=3346562 RepID=UPI003659E46E